MTATLSCAGCNHGYADTALFCPNCGRPKVRTSATDALVGTVLGERFQIQALLGQGSSGTLYRAEHVTLRRKVAIKVLHAELSRDDLAVERFRREATTVADIDNEHIVEIHDFGRTPDGRLYLAMELLEGEGLDALLVRQPTLSFETTADILIQAGEALMEAHAIGYVHRDLRPRNLFLANRRGRANFVKLLDFGLAKLVDSDAAVPAATNLGMTFGDPRYMSPEQARGDVIDRRADIYQLGCVAYEMLTGAPPFAGTRVFDILTQQVTAIPTPLPTRRPGTPLWMEAAVAKMLAKDPANRFATTSRMVEALRVGLTSGEVMDDEVARTREAVPPASVSRVMERLGITEAAAALPPPVVAAPVVAAPAPVAAAPAPSTESGVPRRSTGTPKVGVPIVAAPAQPPQSGLIEPAAAPRSAPDPSGVSQVWFDEGERAEAPARARTASRSAGSASAADLPLDDDDDEAPPPRRRWGLIVGGAGLLLVGGLVAFALTRDGAPASPAPVTAPVASTPPVDAAPSVELGEVVDAGLAPPLGVAPIPTPGTPTGVTEPRVAGTPGRRPPTTPGATGTGFTPPGGDGFLPPGTDRVTPTPITPTPITPTPITPTPTPPTGVSGVDGPLDPYGTGGDPPAAEQTAEQKAAFFAGLGAQQLSSGDTASAAASFKKALELDARSFAATLGMGEIALRQGLLGDAIAHLKQATRLSSRSARAYTLLGEAYLNIGNHAEAASSFKKALQLEPDSARARDGYNEASARVPPPADEP